MKIAYARVSTDEQIPDLQLTVLKRAGCRKIFTDKASGASRKRPQLAKCLASLKTGDVLTVWKLDRLGRSLQDLIALLDDVKGRGVQFRSLTEASIPKRRQAARCGKWSGFSRSLNGH